MALRDSYSHSPERLREVTEVVRDKEVTITKLQTILHDRADWMTERDRTLTLDTLKLQKQLQTSEEKFRQSLDQSTKERKKLEEEKRQEVDVHRKKLKDTEVSRDHAKDEATDATIRLDALRAKLEQVLEENGGYKEQIKSLFAVNQQQKQLIERLTVERDSAAQEAKGLSSKLISTQEENRRLREDDLLQTDQRKLTVLRHHDELTTLTKQLSNRNEDVACLEKEQIKLREELSRITTLLESTQEESARMKKQHTGQLATLQLELDTMHSELRALKLEHKETLDAKQYLENQYESLKTSERSLRLELSTANLELSDLRMYRNRSEDIKKSLEEHRDKQDDLNYQLTNALRERNKENDRMTEQIQQQEIALKRIASQLESVHVSKKRVERSRNRFCAKLRHALEDQTLLRYTIFACWARDTREAAQQKAFSSVTSLSKAVHYLRRAFAWSMESRFTPQVTLRLAFRMLCRSSPARVDSRIESRNAAPKLTPPTVPPIRLAALHTTTDRYKKLLKSIGRKLEDRIQLNRIQNMWQGWKTSMIKVLHEKSIHDDPTVDSMRSPLSMSNVFTQSDFQEIRDRTVSAANQTEPLQSSAEKEREMRLEALRRTAKLSMVDAQEGSDHGEPIPYEPLPTEEREGEKEREALKAQLDTALRELEELKSLDVNIVLEPFDWTTLDNILTEYRRKISLFAFELFLNSIEAAGETESRPESLFTRKLIQVRSVSGLPLFGSLALYRKLRTLHRFKTQSTVVPSESGSTNASNPRPVHDLKLIGEVLPFYQLAGHPQTTRRQPPPSVPVEDKDPNEWIDQILAELGRIRGIKAREAPTYIYRHLSVRYRCSSLDGSSLIRKDQRDQIDESVCRGLTIFFSDFLEPEDKTKHETVHRLEEDRVALKQLDDIGELESTIVKRSLNQHRTGTDKDFIRIRRSSLPSDLVKLLQQLTEQETLLQSERKQFVTSSQPPFLAGKKTSKHKRVTKADIKHLL